MAEISVKTIVIARSNNEDVSWTAQLHEEWTVEVCSNHQPMAREAYAYLKHMVEFYSTFGDEDEIVFCQGNPFDHCPNFIEALKSNAVCFGWRETCDKVGMPRGDWMPMWSYCDVLGLPRQDTYVFIPGAQFRIKGKQIKSRSIYFYYALHSLCHLPKPDKIAWVLERLWPLIFDINLAQ